MTDKDESGAADEHEREEEEGPSGVGMVGAATAVANSKPVAALLGPSFRALGDYFGRRTEEKVDEWERKRQENLAGHAQRVMALEGFPKEGHTERRDRRQRKWAERAAIIDPEVEKELSAVWQVVLGRIMAGDDDADELIEVAKSLTVGEAKFLISFRNNSHPRRRDIHYIEKLSARGLIRKPRIVEGTIVWVGPLTLMLLGVLIIYIGASVWGVVPKIQPLFQRDNNSLRITYILIAGSLTIFISAIFFLVTTYHLTSLGWKLQQSSRRYLQAVDSPVTNKGGGPKTPSPKQGDGP